jgi:hypothetical protein
MWNNIVYFICKIIVWYFFLLLNLTRILCWYVCFEPFGCPFFLSNSMCQVCVEALIMFLGLNSKNVSLSHYADHAST